MHYNCAKELTLCFVSNTILNTCCLLYIWYFKKFIERPLKRHYKTVTVSLCFYFWKFLNLIPYMDRWFMKLSWYIFAFLSYIVLFEKKNYMLLLLVVFDYDNQTSIQLYKIILLFIPHLTHIWTEVTIDLSLYKATAYGYT